MIEITNQDIFGKVVADALVVVGQRNDLPEADRTRCINAIAKAAVRIETSGCFMEFDAGEDLLLIWSDSNEIYEINSDDRCQCKAQEHDIVCWHRVAKRLLERYNEAMVEAFLKNAGLRRVAVHAALEGETI